jgi:hypothetical protein
MGKGGEIVDPRQSARTKLSLDISSVQPNTASVHGDDNFRATFVVDGRTRAPIRLMFEDGGEATMVFEDRRQVDGLLLPYRITTMMGGHVIDELAFDEIVVNPELGRGDFKQ